jgi:hypothetical protein
MLNKDSADKSPQASLSADSKAGAETPVLDPQSVIDGAPGGGGTPDDPGASDHKPPTGIADLEYLA